MEGEGECSSPDHSWTDESGTCSPQHCVHLAEDSIANSQTHIRPRTFAVNFDVYEHREPI